MLIGIASVVSRVKIAMVLLQFEMKYLFFIWKSQPSPVLTHVLDKALFNAPERTLSTGDRP